MAFTYIGNNSGTATAATEIDIGTPAGVVNRDIIISVFAFEGVAAGSGPWIVPNQGQLVGTFIGPSTGWQQVCWQTPSATGVGIEVWCAIFSVGSAQNAKFATSMNAVAVTAAWSGNYNTPSGNITTTPPRLATTAQVVGNQPAAPSVVTNVGELVVACGGDLMQAGGFGAPSGFTNRVDVFRSNVGTVEATMADMTAANAAATGPITFPNPTASSVTAGSTATIVVSPQPTTTTSGGIIDAPLPEQLDIGPGYTLRVSAISPTTGALVPGVNIGEVVLTAAPLSPVDIGDLAVGDWELVPGPGA